MRIRSPVAVASMVMVLLCSGGASSLTVNQFAALCDSMKGECGEHPTLQAYVGGALDLIAVLDEETDYLAKVYCKKPAELFEVSNIIRFMLEHREEYATRNAMLLVVRYLEEKGGCRPEH